MDQTCLYQIHSHIGPTRFGSLGFEADQDCEFAVKENIKGLISLMVHHDW